MAEVKQMLRHLNDNNMRINVVKFFSDAVTASLNQEKEEEEEVLAEESQKEEGETPREKERPVPMLQISFDENENATSGTMNFPDLKKSVTVQGNGLMIALNNIE